MKRWIFLAVGCLMVVMVLAITDAMAVQFTGVQTGPGEWTYTLTYDPLDNYSICQPDTTITLSGLSGVTQAFPPTSTDFPNPSSSDLNLLWTPQVLNGGTTVTWTHVGGGTGNFDTPMHVLGFRIVAPASANGSVSVATSGFALDSTCPTTVLDITATTAGPVVAAAATVSSVPTMTEWGMILFALLAGLASSYYLRKQRKA